MNSIEIPNDDFYMTEDYVYLYKGEPFTGITYRMYNGLVLSENSYKDGFADGPARRWYPETELLYYEKNLKQNHHHGIQKHWYENGQMKSLELIEMAILVKGAVWNQWGELVGVYLLTEDNWQYKMWQANNREVNKESADIGPSDDEIELDKIIEENSHLIGYWPLS